MLPACIVQKAQGSTLQGPLLCRGATTLEANTSYARAAEALYGPDYTSVDPAMLLPDLGKRGLRVHPESRDIGGSTYRVVTTGPNPQGTDEPVTVQSLTPEDGGQCIGRSVSSVVPIFFDPTDPKQGQGGAVYCLPDNVHPSHTPSIRQVDPVGQATATG
jgi:hypothetical protein